MKLYKRLFLLGLALVVILLSLSGRAMAAGAVDTEAETALTIRFVPDGVPAKDVAFRLYWVAEMSPTGVCTALEGWPELPENGSAEEWRQLAARMAEYAAAVDASPAAIVKTDGEGAARAEGLSTGFYLVVGETYYGSGEKISPAAVLVSLPRLDGADVWQYDVAVTAKYECVPLSPTLPQTGLTRWPVPVLLGMGLVLLGAGLRRRRKKG